MIPGRIRVIYEVFRKEISEHFKTKRLLIISIIFAVVFLIVAVWGNYIVGGGGDDEPAYEAGANDVLILMLSITSIFPPILAIALSYDTIVGERTRRSLHLILSKPVDRSSVFIGKFLGSFISIVIVYLIVCTLGYGLVVALSGKVPSLDEAGKAYAAIGIILFSAACWVLFVMLFSTSFKTITSTLIFSIMFWFLILNFISMSGWIYYMVTLENPEEPITVDIQTEAVRGDINNTILTFTPHTFDTWEPYVRFDVRYANGTPVQRYQPPMASITSLVPTYQIGPGEYNWTAVYHEPDKETGKKIASGMVHIDDNFLPLTTVGPSPTTPDNDDHNDFILYLGTLESTNTPFNITVTNLDNGEVADHEPEHNDSLYFLTDLPEGEYRVNIDQGDTKYLNLTFQSYGTGRPDPQMFGFGMDGEEIEYPAYVKVTSSLNPDNDAATYIEILTGEQSPMVFINVQEGLIALTVMFITLFILGLIVFSRIELL